MSTNVSDKVAPLPFKASGVNTIGMEIEFQLLDSASLDLIEGILPLMRRYPDSRYIKPEFIQNTVEVASPVCHSIAELDQQLRFYVKDLIINCRDLGIALCGAGTHPFSRHLAQITPLQRFLVMEKVEGYSSHTQITFATHIHIGMRSGDEAIAVMQRLTRYLPLLIALSANSPYWRGHDTNYDSFRLYILAAARSYGQPPYFRNWQEFSEFFTVVQRAGIFETMNDIHWDIRPRPHLGSLEVRVMDAQSTVSDAVALAAMVQALVAHLRCEVEPQYQYMPNALHHWINRDNYYKAAHHGLRASYFDEHREASLPITQLYEELKRCISPMVALNTEVFFGQLTQMVKNRGGAQWQRQLFRNTHTLKQMVASLVTALESDINDEH